jgi:hypothetical protein
MVDCWIEIPLFNTIYLDVFSALWSRSLAGKSSSLVESLFTLCFNEERFFVVYRILRPSIFYSFVLLE